ncbi:gamma-glutamyltransferase [soil metagenome]
MTFTPAAAFTTRPTLTGSFGMAASTHWLATASAQSVLERGGNAFDAIVAGAFVLHVVEPHLNGPGGDLVGIVSVAGGEPKVLVGQGPAPAGATIEHYRAEGLELVPGAGALAAAVPGAVDAWLLLLRDHGTWELSEVLEYAIGYARDGHPVLPSVRGTIARVSALFEDHWPTSHALWSGYGDGRAIGTNLELANTYERLVMAARGSTREDRIEGARTSWSAGFVAEAIDAFVRTPHRHSTGGDHAGVIRREDLERFRATWEPAVTAEFRGHVIAKSGAWGQGPALLQMLGILDGFEDARLDPSTALGAHTILEAEKLALADRDAWYGDTSVPLDELLSAEYAASRRDLIADAASLQFRPGLAAAFRPPLRASTSTESSGLTGGALPTAPTGQTRGDTCHIDVVDRWGNIASVTPSGGWLQSSPAIPGLGFALGTRLQMTWLDPSSPSALRPGTRPRTTLTPTLVLRDGKPVTALGSPGGDQQDTWQLLYLLRTLVGGYSPQQAIDAPALHSTAFPDSFWPREWVPGGAVVEGRLGASVIAQLRERGHAITVADDWSLGRLSAVGVNADGLLFGAANPRGAQGYAAGR